MELADQGVWINFTAGELLPRWWRVSVSDFGAAIRHVGVKRSVVSSDCGQLHIPSMVEALRMTCQLLLEEDFTPEEIKTMLDHNPAQLLYPCEEDSPSLWVAACPASVSPPRSREFWTCIYKCRNRPRRTMAGETQPRSRKLKSAP